jgi:hypothetical protein
MANLSHITRCGLPRTEWVPFGMNARIAGDTRFLTASDRSTFMEYEHAVTARCNGRRIVTLCSCELAQCNHQQMSGVMHAHHRALERLDASWHVFAVPSFLEALRAAGDLIEI